MTQLVPIAHRIWDMKYRLRDAAGAAVDGTVDDTWRRVARALAAAERAPGAWEGPFHAALDGFRFLPAGRILAGAGTGRDVTLFNCFVMGSVPDDMGGIFAHLREAALTLQQGGGIGYDFSTLRPRGAPVKSVGADASGPLSFMDVWDAMCRTVMSAGYRRGAMMATLACDHPDIEAFIDAKRMPGRLTMFNLSVLASDAFMAAVEADAPWNLTFGGSVARTLRARELWDRIMAATYANAEPGVIFIDRINAENNLGWLETIRATNPCGEQPLPPYGACLLGSLDLARLVDKPFTAEAHIPDAAFARLVPVAVRMLDNAIDVSRFPLPAQRDEALAKRRIGLGVTGLADALALCGARYGSREAVALTERWLAAIARHAYLASAALAAEKGAFSLYERDRFLAAPFVRRLPQEVRDAIAANGIRNGLLTSIAPAGTISLLAGNLSSGIEPIYAFDYERALLMPDGERRRERVEDWAVRLWRETQGEDAPLPQFFVDAQSLAPGDHLVMQAAAQKWVDSSISKTVNVPEDIAFDAFKDIYLQAWRLGCKGCTTYRPNDVTGSVLATTTEAAKPAAAPAEAPRKGFGDVYEAGGVVWMTRSLDRPEALPGRTYKIRWSDSDQAIYITLNDIVREGRRAPFEVFINSKNMEHYAWTVALTRMISAVFRRGGDVSFMVEELKAVFDPRGGQWLDGRYVPSLLAAIGEVIERHMVDIGFLPAREAGAV
ncbi:MAG: adenosylcobalamin-dependent ribonucleoside-diphosphate reductase, partial [Alphaproteobacteria bacterium]|nr:adenosylcobalamin-dependent ribonucleoside-diphosphate reductase [Alphaproteobacteria bacterium]